MQTKNLPPDWSWVKLGDICEIKTGKKDANHAKEKGDYRFYTCAYDYLWCDTKSFSGEYLILPGNGANVGKVFYYKGEFEAYQRTYVLQKIKILPKFLYYHMLLHWRKRNEDKQYGSATNYIRINNFLTYDISYPLFPEQHKIVAKIEELFSELDNGIANLRKAKEQIKTYRQSVLAYAFSGRLHQDSKDLQINRIKESNKSSNPQNRGSDILPKGWKCVKLGEVLKVRSGKGLTSKDMDESGKYSVYGGNGINGYYSKYLFEESKLILGRVGAKCGVAHITKPKSWVTDNALVVDFKIEVSIDFFYYCLSYHNLNKLSVSTAQPVISGAKIYPYEILLPPLIDQNKIVSEIERRFSVADKLEQTIDQSLEKAEQLKQSILKRAFEGKLV
jgi:type I restriction enzyme S subunit